MSRKLAVLMTVLVVLLVAPSLASACPTCKEGLAASDPNYASMVQGYFWSILFLMSMPFLILGSLSSYFYYQVLLARRAASAAA